MSVNPIMLKHFAICKNTDTDTLVYYTKVFMILQELHGASSNQLAASLHSETPSGELWKLLAPPWHCFSAALLNSYHRIALTASLIA